jgi:carboxymethylenebutenolidase
VRTATDIDIPLPAGGLLRGTVALPEGAGPHPGCIVVSDILGLSDDMRRICGRLAAEGYAAIAPDLYSHGSKPLCVARVMGGLVRGAASRTLDDIEAARAHLALLPGVDGDRTVAIGFCMGGGFALTYAAERGGLRAAAVSYGAVPKDRADLTTVCPIVGSYGRLDKPFLAHAERLERHLDELGIDHDVKIYDGVGHSFMNDLSMSAPGWLLKLPSPMVAGYDEAAAEDAWRRILAFFSTHLSHAGDTLPR